MEKLILSRRMFIQKLAIGTAGAIGFSWMLTACGSSGSSQATASVPINGGNCESDGTALETTGVTESHAHTFQLTAAQIAAATPASVFDVSNNGHTHSVQFTSQELASLQANQGVTLTTGAATTDGHTHSLSISCA